ncbi:MAG: hypothetical protein AAGI13_05770 [Pseudomonadota bacterium]
MTGKDIPKVLSEDALDGAQGAGIAVGNPGKREVMDANKARRYTSGGGKPEKPAEAGIIWADSKGL